MYYFDSNKEIERMRAAGKRACDVLGEEQGCVNGCHAGLTFYNETEYGKGGKHEDQECFIVLEGSGMAIIGEEEFPIYPGLTMVAPAGVFHVFKRNADSIPVKIFWFHAAV
jgi:mannose-6-phosphate isomerase-like protein (cupin superfamily)